MKKWTKKEIDLLNRLWFNSSKINLLIEFPDRSWKSLCRKSEELKIKRYKTRNKPYSKRESWIEGEMIGDGHIGKDGRYSHTTKYASYAIFLKNKFNEINISVYLYNHKYKDKRTEKEYSRVLVRTRSFFKIYRERWYKNKKKIIPDDLVINDSSFLHWFMGDGSVDKNGYSLKLSTMGFERKYVIKLKKKLLEYGIESSIHKDNNIFIFKNKNNINKLINFMNNIFYPDCYGYKFDRLKLWISKFHLNI